METLAFLGLLGAGYMVGKNRTKATTVKEGFADSTRTVAPGSDRTPRDAPTVPGKPRQVSTVGPAAKGYDTMFQLPAGGMLPSEPNPSAVQGDYLHFPVSPVSLPNQNNMMEAAAALQMRPDGWEDATPRNGFVSALSGIEFRPGEFKHANMVPFAKKFTQSLIDTANTSTLDDYTGSGKVLYAKREQGPMFEPTKEPTGNPFGFESTTEFMETRVVESRNRANERPMESIRVGPGLNQGYTHLPSGGFQQQAGEDYVQARMPRTNDLRVATNPKLTYATAVVPGKHFITTSGTAETTGEVRKYNPDTFYLNENGERNFVTTGADLKAAVRSAQVIKHTTRPETSKSYAGVAGQSEGKATYTVGSTRAPLVKQMGSYGYRNADLTGNFNPDTDASQNDYGKAGVEILPNERYFTGERVHATNLAPDAREGTQHYMDEARPTRAEETIDNPREAGNFSALGAGVSEKPAVYDPRDVARTTIKETTIDNDWMGMAAPADAAPKLTVYDPNDVARTTIKETTEDNDWIGMAAPADAAQKLTVYDPDDIARVTGRNTLGDWDTYRNFGRQDGPENATTRVQDGVRLTQKAAISAKSAYTGTAEAGFAKAETNRTAAAAMRHYAQREHIAVGRKPMGSSTKIFNGEDNVNLQYRRLVADSVNDRQPGMDRVNSEPTSTDVIGAQRPRAVLKLDVSAIRAEPINVSALERNPYVIPLHKIAAQTPTGGI
jgi:hypothetical protein